MTTLDAKILAQLENPSYGIFEAHKFSDEQLHLAVSQIILGLPVQQILDNYPQLNQWIKTLKSLVPEIFCQHPAKYINHPISYPWYGYNLMSVIKLLVMEKQRVKIINYTTAQPQSYQELESNWQAQLDFFILSKVTNYSPENIYLEYWFLGSTLPKKISLGYSLQQSQEFEQRLMATLSDNSWYHQPNYPQIPQKSLTGIVLQN